jgi:hypothetical protein
MAAVPQELRSLVKFIKQCAEVRTLQPCLDGDYFKRSLYVIYKLQEKNTLQLKRNITIAVDRAKDALKKGELEGKEIENTILQHEEYLKSLPPVFHLHRLYLLPRHYRIYDTTKGGYNGYTVNLLPLIMAMDFRGDSSTSFVGLDRHNEECVMGFYQGIHVVVSFRRKPIMATINTKRMLVYRDGGYYWHENSLLS